MLFNEVSKSSILLAKARVMGESAAIPLSVLCDVQKVRDQLAEDTRRLYLHKSVDGSLDIFLEKVNRTDCSGEGYGDHLNFSVDKIPPSGLLPTSKAMELLENMDSKSEHNKNILPPPAWLRILPACFKAINESELFSDRDSGLRWLAVNVEVPRDDRDARISKTVNINSNKKWEGFKLMQCKDEKPCKALSDILFDLTSAVRSAGEKEINQLKRLPYITWGIRFRTAIPSGYEDSSYRPQIDINASMDNCKFAGVPPSRWENPEELDAILQEVPVEFSSRPPSKPFPQGERWQNFVKHVAASWACKHGTRIVPDQIHQYCRTLQNFYPDGQWPTEGVDCLLCPGFFWSADPRYRGTAATIFWGFEGALTREQCIYLISVSQILLQPLVSFTASADKLSALGGAVSAYSHEVRNATSALFSNYFAPASKLGDMDTSWPMNDRSAAKDGTVSEVQVEASTSLHPENWWVCPVPDVFDTLRAQMLVHSGDKGESISVLRGSESGSPTLQQGLRRLFDLGRKIANLGHVSGVVTAGTAETLLREWNSSLDSRPRPILLVDDGTGLEWNLKKDDLVSQRRTNFIRLFLAACANAVQNAPDSTEVIVCVRSDPEACELIVSLLNERDMEKPSSSARHFGTEEVLLFLLEEFSGRASRLVAFEACGEDGKKDPNGEYWQTIYVIPYQPQAVDEDHWEWLVPSMEQTA